VLLLPCNAVVCEKDGCIFVGAVDAAKMISIVGNSEIEPVARQVNEALRRAVDAVCGA
jgi:hypothetical protein